MRQMLSVFVPLFGLFAIICGACGALLLLLKWERRRLGRYSPLTRDFLRPPGHSLALRLDEFEMEYEICLVGVVLLPFAAFVTHVSQSYFGGTPESFGRIFWTITVGLGFFLFLGWRFVRMHRECRRLKVSMQAEQATAEELNQLMLDGCRVFHDLPFPYGNIDHVVVSPSGVYTVNTKSRGKPIGMKGAAEMTVDYNAGVLRFPDGEFSIPSNQLETESRWLAEWLSSSVGQPLHAEPVLAFPGWFIKERIGRGIPVINPRNSHRFFLQSRKSLSPSLINQVAHQLDQRCRDVEPALKKGNNWSKP